MPHLEHDSSSAPLALNDARGRGGGRYQARDWKATQAYFPYAEEAERSATT